MVFESRSLSREAGSARPRFLLRNRTRAAGAALSLLRNQADAVDAAGLLAIEKRHDSKVTADSISESAKAEQPAKKMDSAGVAMTLKGEKEAEKEEVRETWLLITFIFIIDTLFSRVHATI